VTVVLVALYTERCFIYTQEAIKEESPYVRRTVCTLL
jgi:hypothetical protein